jgi:hypothetical protein
VDGPADLQPTTGVNRNLGADISPFDAEPLFYIWGIALRLDQMRLTITRSCFLLSSSSSSLGYLFGLQITNAYIPLAI